MRFGLFDSGVGGLTVLKSVTALYPQASFVYLADTARLPYGSKKPNEIREIAEEICTWFSQKNIDVFLVACNTTNSLALDVIKKKLDVPVFELIGSASSIVKDSRVGVLATSSTVKTKAYTNAILDFNSEAFVIEQSCPEFVPMIEMDQIKYEKISFIAIEYLKPLLQANIESIILGCSHYPLIIPLLTKLIPPNVRLIDPAQALSLKLKSFIALKRNNFSKTEYLVDSEFCVTSDPENFTKKAKLWLDIFPEVKLVSLQTKACVS